MKTRFQYTMSKVVNRSLKIKAWSLLVLFIAQITIPALQPLLMASPPMAEGEESSASDSSLVDEFTGDFKYSIPLFDLPGPTGGYPFALNYHSGPGVYDEASWVGLGWDLDPGMIARQLRGIPDDFDGQEIITERNIKANRRLTLTLGADLLEEIFGGDLQFSDQTYNLYYDSYTGPGMGMQATISAETGDAVSDSGKETSGEEEEDGGLFQSLDFEYDSQEGFNTKTELKVLKQKMKVKQSSEYGTDRNTPKLQKEIAKSTFPTTSVPLKGFGAGLMVSLGADVFGGQFGGVSISGHYLERSIRSTYETSKAFGVMYEEKTRPLRDSEERYTMDYYLEGDGAVTKFSPRIPLPVHTNDYFSVSGAGIGGTFETKRADISVLRPCNETDRFDSGELGLDLGIPGPTTKVGVDGEYTYAEAFHGKWTNFDGILSGYDNTSDSHANDPTFERAYFKMIDEPSSEPLSSVNGFGGMQPNSLNVSMTWDDVSSKAMLDDQDQTFIPTSQIRTQREKRSTHIAYRTAKEVKQTWNTVPSAIKQYYASPNDLVVDDESIVEIRITQPDGTIYVYGLPVYQNVRKDYFFSTNNAASSISADANGVLTKYSPMEATVDNNSGEYHEFNKTTLPKFATNFLLTAVIDKNYVDLSNNGYTSDDFGGYVAFTYTKVNENYELRFPHRYANFLEGKSYTPDDDHASFTYQSEQLYYLNRAETKTHHANFILKSAGFRTDAMGSRKTNTVGSGESFSTADAVATNASVDNKRRALDRIELYANGEDGSNPYLMKTVFFEYDFSLCKGMPNNVGVPGSNGKLTLKKVWMTSEHNTSEADDKYEFDYSSGDIHCNPDFSYKNIDRWGHYQNLNTVKAAWLSQTGITADINSLESPWVWQNEGYDPVNRDKESAAWSIRSISLPTGGRINIDYESDSYAYVQNKRATGMYGVVGFSGEGNENVSSANWDLNQHNTRIYFLMEKAFDNSMTEYEFVSRYAAGIKELYFKEFVKLKALFGDDFSLNQNYDYVEGFCKIKEGSGHMGVADDNTSIGWIDLEKAEVKYGSIPGHTHPFRKAAWTYIKKNCDDLLHPELDITPISGAIVNNVLNLFSQVAGLFVGYYGQALAMNMSSEVNDEMVSYIRLFDPDLNKYGGGCRVKKISMVDNWNSFLSGESSQVVGTEYYYTMDDGSSSGVAGFEPSQGYEECALRVPDYFDQTYGIDIDFADIHFNLVTEKDYQEMPFGKELYGPTAVGYRRVVIRNLQDERSDNEMIADNPGVPNSELEGRKVKYHNTGIKVKEFFTAKEFPLYAAKTNVDHVKYNPNEIIPLIGRDRFNNHGYSQGYYFETNDMHGKPKSEATYVYAGQDIVPGLFENLVRSTLTEYEYLTQSPFNPDGSNRLSNTVTVLTGNAVTESRNLGLSLNTYVHEEESHTLSIKGGLDGNVEFTPPIFPVITAFPSIEYNESYFRSAAYVKHAHRLGILVNVRTTTDGSLQEGAQLMFDAYTGKSRLTSINNDFDNPVYSYLYAAHWYYPGMRGVFENQRARIALISYNAGNGDIHTVAGANAVFRLGDKLLIYPNSNSSPVIGYVQEITDNDDIIIRDKDGFIPALGGLNNTGYALVFESGNDNMVMEDCGFIQGLENPVEQIASFPLGQLEDLIDALNDAMDGVYDDPQCTPPMQYLDACSFQECVNISLSNGGGSIVVKPADSDKDYFNITFPNIGGASGINWDNVDASLGNGPNGPVIILNPEPGYTGAPITSNTITLPPEMVPCLDGVLHAGAVEYSDVWDINTKALNYPYGLGDIVMVEDNPYSWRARGNWNEKYEFQYPETRKQSQFTSIPGRFNTDISRDGTFEVFHPFVWEDENPEWVQASSIDVYSPYGSLLQSSNEINVSNSRIVAHNNNWIVAEAQQAKQFEIAFESFEDYYDSGLNGYYFSLGANLNTSQLRLINSNFGGGQLQLQANGHSGNNCLPLTSSKIHQISYMANNQPNQNDINSFYAERNPSGPNKKYLVSAWFKPTNSNSIPDIRVYTVDDASVDVHTENVDATSYLVDGWKKLDLVFEAPAYSYAGEFNIEFSFTAGSGSIDDIRIQPYESTMTSYVYNEAKGRQVAVLNDDNFATFIIYDELGNVVTINRETLDGIYTISSSRNHLKN